MYSLVEKHRITPSSSCCCFSHDGGNNNASLPSLSEAWSSASSSSSFSGSLYSEIKTEEEQDDQAPTQNASDTSGSNSLIHGQHENEKYLAEYARMLMNSDNNFGIDDKSIHSYSIERREMETRDGCDEKIRNVQNAMLRDNNLTSREMAIFLYAYRVFTGERMKNSHKDMNLQSFKPDLEQNKIKQKKQRLQDQQAEPVPQVSQAQVRDSKSSIKERIRHESSNFQLCNTNQRQSMINSRRRFVHHHYHHDNDDDDIGTVSSVFSTMSCRELSIQRYRRRIMMKTKEKTKGDFQVIESVNTNEPDQNKETQFERNCKNSAQVQKLLEELDQYVKRQAKLEIQLKQAGIQIAEDIPYEEAKYHVKRVSTRMSEIGSSEVCHKDPIIQKNLRHEYFALEQEMEKYITALMLTDEYIKEQEELEGKWEQEHFELNMKALKSLRSHMPVNIRTLSEQECLSQPTPNGLHLPKAIVKRFKRTNVLQLLRMNPTHLSRIHPSNLENLRVTGLTLTERRALHMHLLPSGQDWKKKMSFKSKGGGDQCLERKYNWYNMMKTNFKEHLQRYEAHIKQYRHEDEEADSDSNLPLCICIGRQCPVKADQFIDYHDIDYGFPMTSEYERSEVCRGSNLDNPGAQAQREAQKLAQQRKKQQALKPQAKRDNNTNDSQNSKVTSALLPDANYNNDKNSRNKAEMCKIKNRVPSKSLPRGDLVAEIAGPKEKRANKKEVKEGQCGKEDINSRFRMNIRHGGLMAEITAAKEKRERKRSMGKKDHHNDGDVCNKSKNVLQKNNCPPRSSLMAEIAAASEKRTKKVQHEHELCQKGIICNRTSKKNIVGNNNASSDSLMAEIVAVKETTAIKKLLYDKGSVIHKTSPLQNTLLAAISAKAKEMNNRTGNT